MGLPTIRVFVCPSDRADALPFIPSNGPIRQTTCHLWRTVGPGGRPFVRHIGRADWQPFAVDDQVEQTASGSPHLYFQAGLFFCFLVPDCTKKNNLAKKRQKIVKFFAKKLQIEKNT